MTTSTDLFDGMIEDIYTLTARPDLDGETLLALRTATNSAHLSDAYPRDLQTMSIQLPIPGYLTQLDIPTVFPRLRGLGSVRVLDESYTPPQVLQEQQVKVIELGDIYDDYGALRSNVAYIAGDKINIRSSILSYGYLVEGFIAPHVRRTEYNSWIAQLFPDVILYWAAAIVLGTNGNEEKSNKYMGMVEKQLLPAMRANFLLGETR